MLLPARAGEVYEGGEEAVEEAVGDLALRAGHYKRITDPGVEPDQDVRAGLRRLRRWGAQTSYQCPASDCCDLQQIAHTRPASGRPGGTSMDSITLSDGNVRENARRAAAMCARLPWGGESACRTDLGLLHAWAGLPAPAMPMSGSPDRSSHRCGADQPAP